MISLQDIFVAKPDHPLHSVRETRKVLARMTGDDASKLEEVTSWLDSIRLTSGFRPIVRSEIIMLLDEFGQTIYSSLFSLYLDPHPSQDKKNFKIWKILYAFVKAKEEADSECLQEYQSASKISTEHKKLMPILCTRLLRTIGEEMKLELMRYAEIDQRIWNCLCTTYLFVESNGWERTKLNAYPEIAKQTSPQSEILRSMLLFISAPGSMTAKQIEESSRIAANLVDVIEYRKTASTACTYSFDLKQPGPPNRLKQDIRVSPTSRFFGMQKAHVKISDVINYHERNFKQNKQRIESEFSEKGNLTVLKHLRRYWDDQSPRRHNDRKAIDTDIEIALGFLPIFNFLSKNNRNIGQKFTGEEKKKSNSDQLKLAENTGAFGIKTNHWDIANVSVDGIGARAPTSEIEQVTIGELCGLKAKNNSIWWVGKIARFQTENDGTKLAGIQLLAKQPSAARLRNINRADHQEYKWESSTGFFLCDYRPAILLTKNRNATISDSLLMEPGSYIPGASYAMSYENQITEITLVELLVEGENFEQISIDWLESDASCKK